GRSFWSWYNDFAGIDMWLDWAIQSSNYPWASEADVLRQLEGAKVDKDALEKSVNGILID
ncbi:hypothetical protein ACFLTK_02965, partial [Chloroflexota bacterium]